MKDQKMEFTCNAKAMNALLAGLPKSQLVKVMDYASTKEISNNMSNLYEGDSKAKKAKFQGYRMQFESLSMHDDEDIEKYFFRVHEVVNTMRGLHEKLDEAIVVQKVLRSLPKRFNPKVSIIEEITNLNSLTLHKLLGILTSYEIRISKGKLVAKESAFKAKNKGKDEHDESCCEADEEEANFVRNLK